MGADAMGVLRTKVERAGMSWERVGALPCQFYAASRHADSVGPVHTVRECNHAPTGLQSGVTVALTRPLRWADARSTEQRCAHCAGDDAILRATSVDGSTLLSVLVLAADAARLMVEVDAETVQLGDEHRWRYRATALRRAAATRQSADPCFTRAMRYAEQIDAALSDLPIRQELAAWAKRHAVGTALTELGTGGAELRRWARTRPCWFVENPEFATRYRAWEQHPAGHLTGQTALVAVEVRALAELPRYTRGPDGELADTYSAPGSRSRAGREAYDALYAMLGGGWTFVLVDTAVADLICTLASRAAQRSAYVMCDHPLAAPAAAAWHAAGMDVGIALHLAVTATASP